MSERRALVVGATGLTGRNAAEQLARSGWEVTGVSRKQGMDTDGVRNVSADISDPVSIAVNNWQERKSVSSETADSMMHW